MRVAMFFPLVLASCGLIGGDNDAPDLVARGNLCGVPGIEGTVIGAVEGSGACGISNAVSVTSVGGVTLSQASSMNCKTARVLHSWTTKQAIPTIGNTGGGVRSFKVAAHYACRTRNHQRGARLSEHAKGNAIDISEFRLADGSAISVLNDWGGGKRGKILRNLHKSACGPFGTVLGPNSDRHHRDHFHFDTASHRGGAYCR